ncbi:MAG: NAD(P)-binding oxidoreductase [Oceanicoccus sp.]
MITLVVGASGATGRLLVEQLLNQGEQVKVIVRSIDKFTSLYRQDSQLTITEANLLDMTDAELVAQVQGCHAVVSCLGHNLTLDGMFGQPRSLVTNSAQRLCQAIEKTKAKAAVKYILMNTTGNQNKQADESISVAQSMVIGLIRNLLPPHADNEAAAAYLQSTFDDDQTAIEWVAVRPDSLIDETDVSEYKTHRSPIRSAIFNAGKTSRINVAHFISQLITDDHTWEKWKRQMPVIYNKSYSNTGS